MRRALVSLLLLILGSGCGVFFAELEAARVCELRRDLEFELAGPPVPLAYSEEVEIPLGDLLPSEATEAQGRVLGITVTSGSGPSVLEFAERARVLLRPSTDAVEVIALEYERGPSGGEQIVTGAGEPFDLRPFLQSRRALVRVELEGTLPEAPFRADLQTCLYLRARYGW
jgi:hypothetical protein